MYVQTIKQQHCLYVYKKFKTYFAKQAETISQLILKGQFDAIAMLEIFVKIQMKR